MSRAFCFLGRVSPRRRPMPSAGYVSSLHFEDTEKCCTLGKLILVLGVFMRWFICLLCAAVACASAATAATITYSDSFNDPVGSFVPFSLNVPRFDPSDGTLTQIDLSYGMTTASTQTHSVTCTNFDRSLGLCLAQDKPGELIFDVGGEAFGPFGSILLEPYGIVIIDCELLFTGDTSCTKTEGGSFSQTGSSVITGPGLLMYEGPGADLSFVFVPFQDDSVTNAFVTLTYTFDKQEPTPIPLPASGALLLVALGAFAIRTRRTGMFC